MGVEFYSRLAVQFGLHNNYSSASCIYLRPARQHRCSKLSLIYHRFANLTHDIERHKHEARRDSGRGVSHAAKPTYAKARIVGITRISY